jgi:hypothetical protein
VNGFHTRWYHRTTQCYHSKDTTTQRSLKPLAQQVGSYTRWNCRAPSACDNTNSKLAFQTNCWGTSAQTRLCQDCSPSKPGPTSTFPPQKKVSRDSVSKYLLILGFWAAWKPHKHRWIPVYHEA